MSWNDFLDPGDVFGFKQDERISRANDALDAAQAKANEASSQNRQLYNDYLSKVNNTYGDMAGKFNDYATQLENTNVYDPGEFNFGSFDENKDQYYSKFANQRAQQAMNAITNSAANAGNMFSSDFNDQLAAKQQALASEEWDKAYDRYMKDRQQTLSEWQANTNAQNTVFQNTYNKNKDLLGMAQNAQDNTMNAYGSYISNLAGQNNTDAQNAANIAQQKAANQNSEKGLFGRIFG